MQTHADAPGRVDTGPLFGPGALTTRPGPGLGPTGLPLMQPAKMFTRSVIHTACVLICKWLYSYIIITSPYKYIRACSIVWSAIETYRRTLGFHLGLLRSSSVHRTPVAARRTRSQRRCSRIVLAGTLLTEKISMCLSRAVMTPLYTFSVGPHQARNDNNTGNGCNPGGKHFIDCRSE